MNFHLDLAKDNGNELLDICYFCGEPIYANDDFVIGVAGIKTAYVHSKCLKKEITEQAEYESRQATEYLSRMR